MKINLKYDKRENYKNQEKKQIMKIISIQNKYLKLIQMEKSLIYIFF